MPQGPAHLHERYGDDWAAWKYLAARSWRQHKGRFWYDGPIRDLEQEERDAAAYLVLEWDWSWGEPVND